MGGKKTTVNTTQNQQQTVSNPAWLDAGSQFAVQRATNIASRAYTPYTGQRVANLSSNENQAYSLAQNSSDEALGYARKAGDTLSGVQRFDQANLNQYMNPYVQSVVDPQLRAANKQYFATKQNLADTRAQRSAFGGDRQALLESTLESEHEQNLADITGRGYAAAYDQAVQTWSQDQDRQIRVADALRATGGDIRQMNTQQIQDLMATGGVSRVLQQANLDFDYQQFLENRDWDVTNLEPLLQTLSSVPHGTSSTGTATSTETKKTSGGALGQVLGAAVTIAGAYFTGGASLALGAGLGSAGKAISGGGG